MLFFSTNILILWYDYDNLYVMKSIDIGSLAQRLFVISSAPEHDRCCYEGDRSINKVLLNK